ncbi:hypothetical protein HK104_005646 [Borealophlyctis nickersoniae]|nr:hypothetical protein HK104_005646 [Borealophlyctis nickersoniae]
MQLGKRQTLSHHFDTVPFPEVPSFLSLHHNHSIGAAGLVLASLLLSLTVCYHVKNFSPSRRGILLTALVSTTMAILTLGMAAFATAGFETTCNDFGGLRPGFSCRDVFAKGFFDGGRDRGALYYTSVDGIWRAIAFGYAAGVAWVLYAVREWYVWKTEKIVWWDAAEPGKVAVPDEIVLQ